jgi:HAD superfamily hydrolase (TIGR01484 family)
MYSVIATDLDGTLLHSDHTLDPFTAETVRTLAARGIEIIIATGRHYRDVAGIRDLLGVDAYLITSNGARVHAPGDHCVYSRNIDPAFVRRLVQPDLAGGSGRPNCWCSIRIPASSTR